MGDVLGQIVGFGAASAIIKEDLSFNIGQMKDTLLGHHTDWGFFVDTSAAEMARYTDDIGDMKQISNGHIKAMMGELQFLMRQGIEYGRKESKQNIDWWMKDLSLSIERSGVPEAAHAEATATLTEMITALTASEGLVTAEIVDLMAQIQAIISGAAEPIGQASADVASAAIEGWETMDFGTWLVNTINANMDAAETAITTGGADIASGLASGMSSGIPEIEISAAQMGNNAIGALVATVQTHSDSKVTYQIGAWVASGFASGIEAGIPDVQAAVTTMGTQVITTGAEVGADIGTSIYDATISEWDDIGVTMKTIGDTAATDAGASFAQRWMRSLQDGIDAGMVSVATASSVMAGVLQTVMDPFAGSALYLGEGRGGPMAFLTLMQQRLDELVKNNTEMISDRFRYREGEDTTGLGLADGYYDRLARTIDLGNRRGSSGDDPKPTRPRWQREIEEILDTVPSGGMFDPLEAAISDILGDGIVDMSDVLKARTGGWDMLAEALMAGIAGTFSSADIAKLATLGLSDESMSAILGFFTKVGDVVEEITIPSERIDVPDTTRDDMWVPSAEDTAFTGNQTVVHVTVDGYVKDTDELIRDINQSIERAGGVAIGTLP